MSRNLLKSPGNQSLHVAITSIYISFHPKDPFPGNWPSIGALNRHKGAMSIEWTILTSHCFLPSRIWGSFWVAVSFSYIMLVLNHIWEAIILKTGTSIYASCICLNATWPVSANLGSMIWFSLVPWSRTLSLALLYASRSSKFPILAAIWAGISSRLASLLELALVLSLCVSTTPGAQVTLSLLFFARIYLFLW